MQRSVRYICFSLALATMAATGGCKHLEGLGNQLGLPAAPMIDDRVALETWSDELDEVSSALRRYDLTRVSTAPTANFRYTFEDADKPALITNTTYPAYLENYVRARQDQVDGLCSLFFNDLQGLSSTSRWGRDQFNALAEFSSLMLGLAGTASKQLAALSGVQVLFNDSYDAASAALLISADPYRVHRAVTTAQTAYAAESAGPIRDFRQAETIVRRYAEPCTLMGVQRLIAEALDTQFMGASEGGTGLAIRLSSLVATLNSVDDGPSQLAQTDLTADSLAAIFWILILDTEGEERDVALAKLPPAIQFQIKALLEPTASSIRAVVAAQLEQIDRLSPSVGRDARKLQSDARAAAAAKAQADARAITDNAANALENPQQTTVESQPPTADQSAQDGAGGGTTTVDDQGP